MSEFEKRANLALPKPPSWLPTATARRILEALSFARMCRGIMVICGDAGVGKTLTAEHFRSAFPQMWTGSGTMNPATAGIAGSLDRLARDLGVPEKDRLQGGSRARMAIEDLLRGKDGLLVVDEAHYLEEPALVTLVSLHKITGVGLVLMGRDTLDRHFEKDDWLSGQVSGRMRLGLPETEDVSMLLDAWGVQGKSARNLCREISIASGTLRTMTKALCWATVKAQGRELKTEHIKAAWREMAGNH